MDLKGLGRLVIVALAALPLGGCLGASAPPAGMAPGPFEPLFFSHDFMEAPSERSFIVEGQGGSFDVGLKIGGEGPSVCGSSNGARILVIGPEDEVLADLQVSPENVAVSTGEGNAGCVSREFRGVELSPGAWRIRFEGSGVFRGVAWVEAATDSRLQ